VLAASIVVCLFSSANISAAAEAPNFLPPGALEEFELPAEADYPNTLAVGSEGSIWFSVDYSAQIDRISTAGRITGIFSIPVGSAPNMPYESSKPTDLAQGADQNMWFLDQGVTQEGYNLVGRVTPTGGVAEFPIPSLPHSNNPYAFAPTAIALGSDGNMWFTDQSLESDVPSFIGRVNPAGEVTEFPIPEGEGRDLPTHSLPNQIALGAEGYLWFTDEGTNSEDRNLIGRIAPNGTIEEFPLTAPYTRPGTIALGAEGNMWFTQGSGTVGRITPAGIVSELVATGVEGFAGGIVLGPDGNMWFDEGPYNANDSTIYRITPAGITTVFARPGQNSILFSLIQGPEHNLWYVPSAYRIARLHVPFAPQMTEPPVLSGGVTVGDVLTVSEGSWLQNPTAFEYQWQQCDAMGLACGDLTGQTGATHVVSADEIGHTLRAIVTAGNVAGATTATSAASPLVQAPPVRPAPPKPPPVVEPPPVVSAAMTWNFGWARTYTVIDSLIVHDVAAGVSIEATCRGSGCAFAHWHLGAAAVHPDCKHGRHSLCGKGNHPVLSHNALNLVSLFAGRHLKIGAQITVTAAESGWIGKSFAFTIRADKPPRVQIICLGTGSNKPVGGC
jgi:virginiamycin B lyase